MTFKSDCWSIILGGSSGFGLATAKKLSQHGMNLCIVHRDRKGAMSRIAPEFEALRATGVNVVTYNVNALVADDMATVLTDLKEQMGEQGSVRMLLHSIAYGNLKLLAPQTPDTQTRHEHLIKQLGDALGLKSDFLQQKIDELFNEADETDGGAEALVKLASPAVYSNDHLLNDEDFALTVHSMGTSLAAWVREIFQRKLFAQDARVIGLTSEGNEISWRGYAAISAAKVSLESVARAIAVEYAPYGIRANIIQAGITDTPALRLIPGNKQLKASAILRNPFNRMTQPEDVANFIYLMCKDEAAWANGNVIRVDGGEHISG